MLSQRAKVQWYSLCWSNDVVSTVINESSKTALECALRCDCSAIRQQKNYIYNCKSAVTGWDENEKIRLPFIRQAVTWGY